MAAFSNPAVLERAAIVGAAKAKAENLNTFPQVSKLVAANFVLFAGVGAAYAGGKCLAEGLTGEKSALNSGIGGSCAGAVLGIHRGSKTVRPLPPRYLSFPFSRARSRAHSDPTEKN